MAEDSGEAIFTSLQERTLVSILDVIIPRSADGQLPGAGEAGVVRHIEHTVRQSPELKPVIEEGLAAADELARLRHGECFAALPAPEQLAVLKELEGFVSSLTFPTYLGYYQNPRVAVALGLGPHPPHPKGYEMEPNDLSLLDAVRRRPKLYRQC